MRAAPLFVFGLVACLVAAACGGDDSGGGSNSTVPPSSCGTTCSPGAICYGPVEPNCNGSWYCWSDSKWYCAPQDSGGPADATLYEATPGDDGPDETSTPTDAGEAGPG